MKSKALFAVAVSSLLLAACQSVPSASVQQQYDPQTQARIRLYGQNQKPTMMTYQQNGKRVKVNVGGSLGDAFSSFVGTASNESIGIAQTPMSQKMKNYNGLLSKVFYREFAIPAGKPVNIRNRFIGLTTVSETPSAKVIYQQGSCNGQVVVFTPQAGKDYEVVPTHNSAACGVTVLEVGPDGAVKALQFGS